MFEFIHHVRILVHDADAMAEYIEENFGLTPVKIEVFPARGMKNAVYKVGQTNVEFTEPLDPDSAMGEYLKTFGPGPYHLAFGVSDIVGQSRRPFRQGERDAWRKRHVPQRGGIHDRQHRRRQRVGLPVPNRRRASRCDLAAQVCRACAKSIPAANVQNQDSPDFKIFRTPINPENPLGRVDIFIVIPAKAGIHWSKS